MAAPKLFIHENIRRILEGDPTPKDWEIVTSVLAYTTPGSFALTAYYLAAAYRQQCAVIPDLVRNNLERVCEVPLKQSRINATAFFTDPEGTLKARFPHGTTAKSTQTLLCFLLREFEPVVCALNFGTTQLLTDTQIMALVQRASNLNETIEQASKIPILRLLKETPELTPTLDLPRLAPYYQILHKEYKPEQGEHEHVQKFFTELAKEYLKHTAKTHGKAR